MVMGGAKHDVSKVGENDGVTPTLVNFDHGAL
jgi:hypothetical protein